MAIHMFKHPLEGEKLDLCMKNCENTVCNKILKI